MKLALGTAQFGLQYGIANQSGQIAFDEARSILFTAKKAGIDTLDTAVAYGNSEEQLGLLGIQNWKVVSKIPPLPNSINDIEDWVMMQLNGSLQRLGVDHLDCMLMHRPLDLIGSHSKSYIKALRHVKEYGFVNSIGYSIYSPDELAVLCPVLMPDIIQAPLNIIDRRLISSGWMAKLVDMGIRIHTRSAFLQGLLLMPIESRPIWFKKWQHLWQTFFESCKKFEQSPLSLSLQYVLSHPDIERIVIGVDSVMQLQEIINAACEPVDFLFPSIESNDIELLEPSRWKFK